MDVLTLSTSKISPSPSPSPLSTSSSPSITPKSKSASPSKNAQQSRSSPLLNHSIRETHQKFQHLLLEGHSEGEEDNSFVLKCDYSFVLNADSLQHLSFNVDIYEKPDDEEPQLQQQLPSSASTSTSSPAAAKQEEDANPRKLIGRVHSELSKQLRGVFTRSILNSDLEPIGYLNLDYLIITPFIHPMNNLSSLWDRNTKDFYIGHRGTGANNAIMKQVIDSKMKHTICSFPSSIISFFFDCSYDIIISHAYRV